jgi:hypothetical protein
MYLIKKAIKFILNITCSRKINQLEVSVPSLKGLISIDPVFETMYKSYIDEYNQYGLSGVYKYRKGISFDIEQLKVLDLTDKKLSAIQFNQLFKHLKVFRFILNKIKVTNDILILVRSIIQIFSYAAYIPIIVLISYKVVRNILVWCSMFVSTYIVSLKYDLTPISSTINYFTGYYDKISSIIFDYILIIINFFSKTKVRADNLSVEEAIEYLQSLDYTVMKKVSQISEPIIEPSIKVLNNSIFHSQQMLDYLMTVPLTGLDLLSHVNWGFLDIPYIGNTGLYLILGSLIGYYVISNTSIISRNSLIKIKDKLVEYYRDYRGLNDDDDDNGNNVPTNIDIVDNTIINATNTNPNPLPPTPDTATTAWSDLKDYERNRDKGKRKEIGFTPGFLRGRSLSIDLDLASNTNSNASSSTDSDKTVKNVFNTATQEWGEIPPFQSKPSIITPPLHREVGETIDSISNNPSPSLSIGRGSNR